MEAPDEEARLAAHLLVDPPYVLADHSHARHDDPHHEEREGKERENPLPLRSDEDSANEEEDAEGEAGERRQEPEEAEELVDLSLAILERRAPSAELQQTRSKATLLPKG